MEREVWGVGDMNQQKHDAMVELVSQILISGGSIFVQRTGGVVVELHVSPEICRQAVTKATTAQIAKAIRITKPTSAPSAKVERP
jgi:hypothetical protein